MIVPMAEPRVRIRRRLLSGVNASGARKPPLSIKQILAWADAHHKRTGEWPYN